MSKDHFNLNFIGALTVLSGLFFSLFVPLPNAARVESEANDPAAFAETSLESKKPDYGKMPLLFEENKGQTDRRAKFVSRGAGYTLYLTETGAVFSLKTAARQAADASLTESPKTRNRRPQTEAEVLQMRFADANKNPSLEGADEAVTKTNYYQGRKRLENLSNYKKVNYKNLYDGIDAVFYGNARNRLEYDFVVAPQADAARIGLYFDGAENLSVDAGGNLIVKTARAELVQQKPFAYQEIGGERKEIAVSYKIEAPGAETEDRKISFALGAYDRSKPLVIDPVLNYLTYIGGTAFDQVFEVAADAQGNAYLTGSTTSLDFHGETRSADNGQAAFAAKLNPDGTQFIYITILEGDDDDGGFGIALDAANNAYLAGFASKNFPSTSGAFDENHGASDDAFATKLNANGNLVYSTFIGGSDHDQAFDIAVDASGRAYVVGETFSTQFFPTKNRFQGCGVFFPTSLNSLDAFLTVFNAAGSDITYSTCIGGSVTQDSAFSVALDSANNAYVTGRANGGNFPTKNAAQPASGGGVDAFIAKFNPALSGNDSLIYSTYLGGSGTDIGFSIAVAANGTASVTGVTGSTNFPLLNAFDTTNQVNEAFIAQYNSSGTKLNSTFLGGADQDQGMSIALGSGGTVYVAGNTLSNDFPLAVPFQSTRRGLRDAFVTRVRFGANNNPGVASSSYLGGNGNEEANGIAVRGNFIFIGGETQSNNLLTTAGVIKPTSTANASSPDGYVAKILDTRLDTIGTFNPANTVFNLRNTLTGGAPDITVDRGIAGDVAVAGDFNGDSIDTVSLFQNGVWKIFNVNVVSGYSTGGITVNFGTAGDLPVVGDWNNDGIETPGVFRPSVGQFFLTNAVPVNNSAPNVDLTIDFGAAGDLPVAGDWNADGIDSVGVFRPSAGQFFLTNQNVLKAGIDFTLFFGIAEDLPVAGDFDGSGTDTIGVWRPSVTTFFLTDDNVSISNSAVFGASGDRPVIGDWEGKPNQ